jgi:hypothetical protein
MILLGLAHGAAFFKCALIARADKAIGHDCPRASRCRYTTVQHMTLAERCD